MRTFLNSPTARTFGVLTSLAVAAVAVIVFVPKDDGAWADTTNQSTMPQQAFQHVAKADPSVVSSAAPVTPSAAKPQAVSTIVSGTKITIPQKATAGISVGDVKVTLPFANQASNAVPVSTGTVAYNNNNGTATVPVAQSNGSVQINTVIAGPPSPTSFSYNVNAGVGTSLQNTVTGAVGITNSDGVIVGIIETPWAKDANGNPVPTHYVINGATLTQVVDISGVKAFPVVVDPKIAQIHWWGTQLTLSKAVTRKIAAFRGIEGFVGATGCPALGLSQTFEGALSAVICGGIAYLVNTQLGSFEKAARHRECAQINQIYGLNPWFWTVGSVKC